MKTTILSLFAVMLLAAVAHAGSQQKTYLATDADNKLETGLSGDAMSGGATSDNLDLGETFWASTVAWQVDTTGASGDIVVTCEESSDGTVWVVMTGCSNAIAATCAEKSMAYPSATLPDFSLVITAITAQYLRCTFTAAAGTVSASMTAGN